MTFSWLNVTVVWIVYGLSIVSFVISAWTAKVVIMSGMHRSVMGALTVVLCMGVEAVIIVFCV